MQSSVYEPGINDDGRRERWLLIIKDFIKSKMTQIDYSKKHNLKKEHLSYYYRKYHNRAKTNKILANSIKRKEKFIPVAITDVPDNIEHNYTLKLQNGYELLIHPEFRPATLAKIISVLRTTIC